QRLLRRAATLAAAAAYRRAEKGSGRPDGRGAKLKAAAVVLAVLICAPVFALSNKEAPVAVITWPSAGKPMVKLSFGKAVDRSSGSKQHFYVMDVLAENLWDKPIKS